MLWVVYSRLNSERHARLERECSPVAKTLCPPASSPLLPLQSATGLERECPQVAKTPPLPRRMQDSNNVSSPSVYSTLPYSILTVYTSSSPPCLQPTNTPPFSPTLPPHYHPCPPPPGSEAAVVYLTHSFPSSTANSLTPTAAHSLTPTAAHSLTPTAAHSLTPTAAHSLTPTAAHFPTPISHSYRQQSRDDERCILGAGATEGESLIEKEKNAREWRAGERGAERDVTRDGGKGGGGGGEGGRRGGGEASFAIENAGGEASIPYNSAYFSSFLSSPYLPPVVPVQKQPPPPPISPPLCPPPPPPPLPLHFSGGDAEEEEGGGGRGEESGQRSCGSQGCSGWHRELSDVLRVLSSKQGDGILATCSTPTPHTITFNTHSPDNRNRAGSSLVGLIN